MTVFGNIDASTKSQATTDNRPSNRQTHRQSTITHGTHLVAIAAQVEDIDTLIKGVVPGASVVVLDADRDGVSQITRAIHSAPSAIDSIHIISHGSPGCLYVGASQRSLDTLERDAAQIQSWFAPTISTPQLYLYGCNVAAGDAGAEFLAKLHVLTGAAIAASTSRVGNAALGGSWHLDVAIDHIHRSLAFTKSTQQHYSGAFNTAPVLESQEKIALDLDGANDFVALPNLGLSGNTSVSVSAWINANDALRNNIFGFGNAGQTDRVFSLRTGDGPDGQFLLYFWTTGLYVNGPSYVGQWTHVAATYDSATRVQKVFVNGVEIGSQTGTVSGTPNFVNANYRISGFNNEYFDGSLDEVGIWNRALSTTEIQTIYNNNIETVGGTLAYYSFVADSNGSTVITDQSGNNFNGTLINGQGNHIITATPVGSPIPVSLAAVNEDAAAPTGAVGTLVSDLVDLDSAAGGNDNVNDPDAGAATGIALTAVDITSGSWFFTTDGGTTWTALGAVSETNARLLAADANTRLYFQPSANFNGDITDAITFRAWDQTIGANGDTGVDVSTNGGTTAFSAETGNASITVTAVNDAPSFTKGGDQSVAQDAGSQTVTGWASAIAAGPTDEADQNLTFQVSNDNNALFSAQPTIDSTTGNLTYTAAAGVTGSAIVTVNIKDDGGTANGGVDTSADQTFSITVKDTTNPTVTVNIVDAVLSDTDNSSEVTFAFSEVVTGFTKADLTVESGTITDVSTIDNQNFTATFTADDNSTTDGKVTVNGGSYTDGAGNTGAEGSDTVTVDTTNPTLTNFTRQTPGTEATDANALVFRATFDEDVQNVDAADFVVMGTSATISNVSGSGDTYDITVTGGDLASLNGTVSLNLAAGQNITDTAGNALPASEPATDEAYILSNDNTAPTLTGNTALTAINEDVLDASNLGTTVAALLANAGLTASDTDLDPLGIAVTTVDDTNGTWQYSTDGGATWAAFGVVGNTNAVTLGATSLYTGFNTINPGPDDQGYFAFASVILGTPPSLANTETEQTVGVTVDTTADKDIYAGYSNHIFNPIAGTFNPVDALPGAPDFPTLDSTAGYTLSFNAQVVSEVVESGRPRAGFSVIAVSQDPSKAVELAFQAGQIFAQTLDGSNQFIASTTDTVTFDTTKEVQYSLAVQGNSYTLSANGTAILTGTLQDYTSGNTNGGLNPYNTSNFLFLGDNTTSARGEFRLNQIAVETPTLVRFVPDTDYTSDATLNFRAWDTTDGSANGETSVDAAQTGGTSAFSAAEATATITVNAVNDAPVIANLNGDSVTHTVGQAATLLDVSGDSAVNDIDSNDFAGGTLTIAITNSVTTEDLLTLDTTGNIALSGTTAGSTVSVAGTVVGTLANAIATGSDLMINLNANATPTNVPALLRALQYQNTDVPNPDITARSVQVTLTDGDGGTSTASTVTVNLQIAPEIDIQGNSVSIADGDTTPSTADDTNFGFQAVASGSITKTFTINNLGSNDLVLSGSPLVQLSDDTHFSVSAQPASFASVGGSTTFDITFDPAAAGFHTTTVTVASNDSDEGIYTFDLQGYGQPFVIINEIDADTAGTDALEFIELYDGGAGNTALDGLVLVLYNGNGDKVYDAIDLDGQTTDANGYFVIGSAAVANVDLVEFTTDGLQNGADAVALHVGNAADFSNGTAVSTANVVDAVVYDTNDADDAGLLPLITAGGQLNEDANGEKDTHSLQRIPNGGGSLRDTSSFAALIPTPGAANLPGVEFTQATYTSSEGDGTSNVVTVTRGSAIGAASVQVAVQGTSTATGGSDYTDTGFPLTVNFADGEASQTVAIPLTDDAAVEGDETLVLGLQNPTNLTLGSQTTTTLTITDNDSPGFTIVESGGMTQVDESGTTDTFIVVLNTQPLSDVELAIATKTKSKAGDEATSTPTTLTFTLADWDQAQTVTVTGVDDDRDDGDQTNTLIISVVDANSDDAFDALADQTVNVTTVDNDTAGITLTESGGSTAVTEGGMADSYTLVLDTQPTDTVTINLTPDAQTQLDKTTVMFTTADWDQAQTVTVTAVDDGAIEGNHTSSISAAVTSGDAKYDGFTLAPVIVAIADNDIQTVNLAVSANSGTEAAGTIITVTATADGAVNGDQTVDLAIAGSNITASDYDLSNPVITILNGQTTGTATFTVLDDALVEGAETATLSLSNPSAGLLLGATTSQTIAIADNDQPPTSPPETPPTGPAPSSAISSVFNFEQWVSYTAIRAGQAYQSSRVDFNVEIGGLRIAPLFDETDYLNDNPDVALAVQQGTFNYGFEHFVLFGINESRAPSDWFDADYYLAQNADVAAVVSSGQTTAIAHFLNFGHRENRDPSAFFDSTDYLLKNSDVKAAVEAGALDSAFEHFIEFGAEEGRLNGLLFEESFYLQQNPDVAVAVQSGAVTAGLYHFLSFGQAEGRDPSAAFDQSTYLERYSDVAAAVASGAFASGFEHYVLNGRAEGRMAV
ncbi:MAG: DUF4347 domain-containing protein [Leptolyngbyaceae cyanobacterium]